MSLVNSWIVALVFPDEMHELMFLAGRLTELGSVCCVLTSCWELWAVTRHFGIAGSVGMHDEWEEERKPLGLVRLDECRLCASLFCLKSIIPSPGSY